MLEQPAVNIKCIVELAKLFVKEHEYKDSAYYEEKQAIYEIEEFIYQYDDEEKMVITTLPF